LVFPFLFSEVFNKILLQISSIYFFLTSTVVLEQHSESSRAKGQGKEEKEGLKIIAAG